MYKEVILMTTKDNIEKHAYILIWEDPKQLDTFCKKIGIEKQPESSFVYKSINEDNKAYIVKTDKNDNVDNINPCEFLEKILGIINGFGKSDLLSEEYNWSIQYVAKQFGIKTSWKNEGYIDEEKLDKLANNYVKVEEQYMRSINDKIWNAYVQGYRKAKED